MFERHSISDESLGQRWDQIVWKDYEKTRNDLQRQLSVASANGDEELLSILTEKFLTSFEVRAVAVRNVTRNEATDNPGVGEPWASSADYMKGAMILSHLDYKSEPFYSFVMFEPKTKKNREMCIPSFYDRAMHDLFRMLLAPIVEPLYDLRLFSSREGRSLQDAVVEVCNIFSGPGAPEFVVRCDVRSFYDSMAHSWLLDNVPMDRHILSQFLNPGRLMDGNGPIRYCDHGVPTGNRLSPILANLILNGLEEFIADPKDSLNGVVVRWVDDFVISARSLDEAFDIYEKVQSFLAVRGLSLNKDKSYIACLDKGFEFLKFRFQRVGDRIDISPSEHAIEDEKEQLLEAINRSKTPANIVTNVNNLIRGFATKYRISDISMCSKDLDDFVLRRSILKVSSILSITNAEAVERFLKHDKLGRNRFILEDGSMIRYFMDIERVPHERVWLTANPFIDTDYFTERKKRLDIIKHVGRSPDHWSSSNGRCAICGLCIFYYQDRRIAQDIDGTKAYVHDACWEDTFILRNRKRFRFHPSSRGLETIVPEKLELASEGIEVPISSHDESKTVDILQPFHETNVPPSPEASDDPVPDIETETSMHRAIPCLESYVDQTPECIVSENLIITGDIQDPIPHEPHHIPKTSTVSTPKSDEKTASQIISCAYSSDMRSGPSIETTGTTAASPSSKADMGDFGKSSLVYGEIIATPVSDKTSRVVIPVSRGVSIFQPLIDFLDAVDVSYVTMKFFAVDQIMGGRLCKCARTSRAWWYKTDRSSIKHALQLIGWRVGKVDIKHEEVRFIHNLISKSKFSIPEQSYMSRRFPETAE